MSNMILYLILRLLLNVTLKKKEALNSAENV